MKNKIIYCLVIINLVATVARASNTDCVKTVKEGVYMAEPWGAVFMGEVSCNAESVQINGTFGIYVGGLAIINGDSDPSSVCMNLGFSGKDASKKVIPMKGTFGGEWLVLLYGSSGSFEAAKLKSEGDVISEINCKIRQ